MRWLLLLALALGGLSTGCQDLPPERHDYGETDAFGPGEFPYPPEDQERGVAPAPERRPEEPYRGE